MGIMNKLLYKKRGGILSGTLVSILIFLGLFLFLAVGVDSLSQVSDEESYRILKDAVLRSAIQCYAIEGMYPPDIRYLEENYGLTYDHEQYIIHYEVFASNILPDIAVIDRNVD